MEKEFYEQFSKEEEEIIKKCDTPKKIQDFLNALRANYDYKKDTCQSPKQVLKSRKAHCIEGAILAAAILRYHGYPPLLVDLESTHEDFDHVIAVFKQHGHWGALSKTNHAVLRYREPIYKSIRELIMSFFHEYFLNKNGKKTLRRYSKPVNLERFDHLNWISTQDEVWFIAEHLANIKHIEILNKNQIANLRPADIIEIQAGKLTQYPEPTKTK
jgi:hypothetical protein